MKHITTGDAITIAALLAFAVGWFLVLDLSIDIGTEEEADISGGAAMIMSALWFGPPLWAFWLITLIVRGDDR